MSDRDKPIGDQTNAAKEPNGSGKDKKTEPNDRQARLAEALRANLRRRKAKKSSVTKEGNED